MVAVDAGHIRHWRWLVLVLSLAIVTLGLGLGRACSGYLSYHEAFVAQASREMLTTGHVVIPTLGGRPWLEKPPLAIWLVVLTSCVAGGVTELTARLPSALAAIAVVLGVSTLATRRFGSTVGLLAGLVQATTSWTVMRGRLAEADMLLACLITWTLVAYDALRTREDANAGSSLGAEGGTGIISTSLPTSADPSVASVDWWRWAFFAALGLTALAKGVGFGAVLIVAVVGLTLVWDRDGAAYRRLRSTRGWILTAMLALAWPLLVVLRHPSALGLWVFHVSDRLATTPEHFTGSRSWWFYGPAVLIQLLPWTPVALLGALRSIPRAPVPGGRGGGDRLLWAWAIAPVVLLSLATVKSAHYAIHALPPWSIWAALGIVRVGERLQALRGWSAVGVKRAAWVTFAGLGLAYAVAFTIVGPWFHHRGRAVEWAFYEQAGHQVTPGEPVALLYHVPDWDREPYVTPFGPVPHDWGIRLFYLQHPAPCRFGIDELATAPLSASGFAVIGRPSDLVGLRKLGRVDVLAQGPTLRASGSRVDDRTYRLYRVTPEGPAVAAGRNSKSAYR